MISKEYKELAHWAMEECMRQGCQGVRVIIYSGTNTDFEVRDKQLDKLQQSSENQLIFNLYLDNRFGSFSTNRMEKTEIGKFIENAVESVRYLAADPCRQLPDAARYYKGGKPDLDLCDKTLNEISPDEKLKLAHDAADEILGSDERILSVQSSYSDGESFSYMLASNGFEGESAHSYFSLSVSVSVKGDGEARPESFWYDQALSWNDLQKKGIGKIALERTLQKLGQQKVASGTYNLLVDNLNAGRLLSPILSALNGAALQQKNSFLMDKLGEQVLSEKVTIIDNPHLPHSFGASYFDHEGVATQKRFIFNKGVLETFFIDTYNAHKMHVEPTVSSISQLVLEKGERSLEEMVSTLERGILVTGFNGGNSNSTSGDFSFGVEGFLIEHGKRVKPISEMNVTGNMLTLWQKLAEIGNDPRLNNAYQIPSLLFNDVDFSGL
ncbi:MAG TPA: TldD/PmbA family protein [Bacteroidales bacterium]|nr:TldD/PmbA family protein [Bacteroidales bacterium]